MSSSSSDRGWVVPFPNPVYVLAVVIFAPILLLIFLVTNTNALKRIGIAYVVFVRKTFGWAVIINIIVGTTLTIVAIPFNIIDAMGVGSLLTLSFVARLLALIGVGIAGIFISKWLVKNRRKVVGPPLIYSG
ncbi:hypothetical protein [Halopenitus malekzadehii]|uniref:hypothetical protein n=1 Tax=Halopenitus malekzadehii TaxID=1267564 RepID=UPI00115FAB1C|nr:hypothetical protein [Halopenitus malekzadehii]